MSTVLRSLVFVSSMAAMSAAEASEYQCRKADSTLRIAVEVAKAGHTLPCEVIAEDDRGERAILYSAQYDRAYCPNQINVARAELEQEGWACEKTSDINIVRGEGVTSPAPVETAVLSNQEPTTATNGRTITKNHQCRLGDEQRLIQIEVENPSSGKPCEIVYWDDGDQRREGQILWRAVHDAGFCPTRMNTIVSKWAEEGWVCSGLDEPQTAALTSPETVAAATRSLSEDAASETNQAPSTPTESKPASADLQEMVEEDARRIGEWMEVDPDIEIAARGDLNDDGSEDAVVFLAYQSDQAAYRQYLMSYLGAEGGFELASVKLLTGVNAPPAQARVEQIDDGVIWLSIPGNDGEEPTPAGFKLHEQQLIEVDGTPPANATAN